MQFLIHIRREEWESKASQTPQHRRGRDGASRIPGVRVDDICLDTLKASYDAGSKDSRADIRHDPVGLSLRGPPVYE